MNNAAWEQNNPGAIFTPPYSYTPEPANETLRQKIIANAGWQNVSVP